MKRHILSILLFLFVGIQTWAHHFEVDGIYYNYISTYDKTVSVTYRGASYQEFENEYRDVVEIPSSVEYNGESYNVLEIDVAAFKDCSDLKEITLPDGIKRIRRESFSGCVGLESVNIPLGVEEVQDYAFQNCTGLKTVIITAKHITTMDKTSFSGSSNVEEVIYAEGCLYATRTYLYSAKKITISNTVTELGLMMCDNFKNLEEVSIPGNVITIYDWAFDDCVNLRRVDLHEGLKRIGNQVFRNCPSLKNIVIPSTVNSIATEAFSGVVKAFFKTNSKPSFGNNPFKSCQIYYTKNSVSYGIPGKHVEYPLIDSMFEVDNMVYIPTSEENNTCDFVDGLYSMSGHIPSKVMNNDCTYSVSKLGDYAFYGSKNLVKVTIPNSIATRGQYAFNECPKIDSVVVSCDNLEDFASYVSRSNIYDVFYAGILENKHHAITICGSEISSLIIPNTVNCINNYAFKGCSNVISVDISEGVTSIGSNAFYGCENMTSATIPSSVTSIGDKAFYNVIKTVFLTNSKPLIATDAFFSNQVYYTSNSDSYNIPGIQKVYPLLSSKFEVNGIKYIPTSISDRTCDMYDIDYTADYISPIIGPNVKFTNSSGRQYDFKLYNVNAYAGFKSKVLSELQFKNEGTIESYAFYECNNIKAISFGENITTIGESAFSGCTGITTLKIPATIKQIDKYAFNGCTSLDSLIFEDSNAPIRLNCRFENGEKLYLGRNVVYSMVSFSSPFSGNPRLEKVTTSNNVTNISYYEFYNCRNLKDVCLSDSVKNIGDYAFSGNSSLLTFEVGKSVCEIGSNAFSDCTGLLAFISHAITPAHVAQGALDDINKMECTLHVPVGSKDAYKQADQWKEFWIEDDLEPSAIENIIYDNSKYENKTFDILGRVIDSMSVKGIVISKGKKYLRK